MAQKSNSLFKGNEFNERSYTDLDPLKRDKKPITNPDNFNKSGNPSTGKHDSCIIGTSVSVQALKSWNAFRKKFGNNLPFLVIEKESS